MSISVEWHGCPLCIPLNDVQAQVHLYGFNLICVRTISGACAQSLSMHTCALGSLAPGESATIAVQLSAIPGDQSRGGSVHVTSATQPIRTSSFSIEVTPRADLVIDPLPLDILAVLGEPVEVPIVIRSVGVGGLKPTSRSIAQVTPRSRSSHCPRQGQPASQ